MILNLETGEYVKKFVCRQLGAYQQKVEGSAIKQIETQVGADLGNLFKVQLH